MIASGCQRWRGGRANYRPVGEPIDPSKYEVAAIDGAGADNVAKAFVLAHHYSKSYPAALERVGLYRSKTLVGLAVFSEPVQGKVLDCLPCPREESCELGRLVLLQDVPANGESWFIARAFEIVRGRGYAGVVSFADPIPRTTAAGRLVFPGHVGTIYQASNATYTGLASPQSMRLLPDGRSFSNRARGKIIRREKGWRYAVDQLVEAGAAAPEGTSGDELRGWLARELPRVTRPLRHSGNLRYLFGLTPAVRRRLPASLPYVKVNA